MFSNLNPSYGFFDFGGWEKKYNLLFDENEKLKNEIDMLKSEISKLHEIQNIKISRLESSIEHWKDQAYEFSDKLQNSNNKLSDQISRFHKLNIEVSELERSNEHWKDQAYEFSDKLQNSNNKLSDQIRQYDKLSESYSQVYDEAFKPRVEIDKTKLHWTFRDSKGNDYGVVWDIDTYEKTKIYSDKKSLISQNLRLNLDGQTITTIDLDGFITGNFVDCCIDKLYENSKSNSDFIWEVWWIVSQMTVYDKDVSLASEGRYALETIHRGGGDCEDLVILIADMIKSSSYAKNWDMEIIYMDADNHNDPKTVNHLILHINDGTYSHYIEATGEPRWDYYPNGVNGWWFEV